MFEGIKGRQGEGARALEQFKSRVAAFEDVFRSLFTVTRLKSVFEREAASKGAVYDELLRYVHRCVSCKRPSYSTPRFPSVLE